MTTAVRSALLSVGLLACADPSPAPQPDPEPAVNAERDDPSAQAKSKQDAAACRDWSGLDRATLPPLPPSPHTATFERVWSTVLEKHFDPTLSCQDWPGLRQRFGERVAAAKTPEAAYAAMNELLATLGQSHFQVIGPSPNEPDFAVGPARVPIQVRVIEGRPVVVEGEVDGVKTGVPRGAVLVEIDGREVSTLLADPKDQGPKPNPNPNQDQEGEPAGHAIRQLERALRGPEGHVHTIVFLDPSKSDARTTREVACALPKGERISLGNMRDLPTRVDSRMIEGTKLGYLAFNYWMLPMIKDVETRLAALRGQDMTALILDLRGNPGGVGAMSIPVARQFLTEEGSLGTLRFREFEQKFVVAANPDAFTGPLVILVDEGTASTSEIFATGLRDLGRATIVGAGPSAGAALPSLIERLDDGALLQYVVGDYHSSRGRVAEGTGVTLDVTAPETRADFIAGRDPVLEAAVTRLTDTQEANR